MKELIEKLNNLKIIQTRGDWEEDIPEDIWAEHFEGKNLIVLAEGIDVDTHRWYETSTTVYDIEGALMGVECITNTFSEMQDYASCYHTLTFYEMEEFQTISYRAKNN